MGNALRFNKENDYDKDAPGHIYFPTTIACPQSKLTFEVYCRILEVTGDPTIYSRPVSSTWTPPFVVHRLGFFGHTTRPEFQLLFEGEDEVTTLRDNSPIGDAWAHIAATFDGSSMRLYVNGALSAQKPKQGVLASSKQCPVLGIRSKTDFGGYLNGVLKEFRLWSIARTEQEIFAWHDREMIAPQVGLEGLYHLTDEIHIARVEAADPHLLLHSEIVNIKSEAHEGKLVTACAIPWQTILREIQKNPSFLHHFAKHPRQFEEFLAGCYDRAGCPEVILTPSSNDLGRDVIATWPGMGAIRIYDQAKAFSPHRKVSANDVRALLGILDRDKNVSKGIMTTTAEFAPGIAREFKDFIPHRIELRDGKQLCNWLNEISSPFGSDNNFPDRQQ